jgi:hypothetical protein
VVQCFEKQHKLQVLENKTLRAISKLKKSEISKFIAERLALLPCIRPERLCASFANEDIITGAAP